MVAINISVIVFSSSLYYYQRAIKTSEDYIFTFDNNLLSDTHFTMRFYLIGSDLVWSSFIACKYSLKPI